MATCLVQKGDSGQVNPDGRQAEVGAEVGREQGYMTLGDGTAATSRCLQNVMKRQIPTLYVAMVDPANALLTRDARSLSRDRLIPLAWLLVEGRPEERT